MQEQINKDLAIACANGRYEKTLSCLKAGADVNYQCTGDASGWTPIMCACASGSLPIVKELYNKGADIYTLTNEGCNLLHYACQNDDLELTQFIHKCGINLLLNKNNVSPLHCAESCPRIVEYIIAIGGDIHLDLIPKRGSHNISIADRCRIKPNDNLSVAISRGLKYLSDKKNMINLLSLYYPTVLCNLIGDYYPLIIE